MRTFVYQYNKHNYENGLSTGRLAYRSISMDECNRRHSQYLQAILRLQACIVAICTEGSMKASINLLDYEIRPNDPITLLPGTIIQFRERTEKVCSLLCRLFRTLRRTNQPR